MSNYEPATCAACGTAWADHLGCEGTCAALQEARAEVARLRRALTQAIEWMGEVHTLMGPNDRLEYPDLAAALRAREVE